jgi:hypothetical protein
MKQLIFFVLLGLVFTACEKGTGNFVLEGKITDATFNTGLSGATLKLYKTPIGTTSSILVETLTLPTEGTYSLTFPREKMEKYTLVVNKNNYFEIEQDVYYSELSIEENNIRNYSTKAKAWVKLRFKNNSPMSGDHLRYIKQAGLQGCETCCPNTEQIYYGALDLTFTCVNRGNQPYSFYYWVVNTANQGLKEVVTTPFDTVNLSLIY